MTQDTPPDQPPSDQAPQKSAVSLKDVAGRSAVLGYQAIQGLSSL